MITMTDVNEVSLYSIYNTFKSYVTTTALTASLNLYVLKTTIGNYVTTTALAAGILLVKTDVIVGRTMVTQDGSRITFENIVLPRNSIIVGCIGSAMDIYYLPPTGPPQVIFALVNGNMSALRPLDMNANQTNFTGYSQHVPVNNKTITFIIKIGGTTNA
jgi:hypothetical protein